MNSLRRRGVLELGELVDVRMEWIQSKVRPLLQWWLGPIYSGLGPLPKCSAGRDPTTAMFEARQLVQAILTKGGLRLPKALVVMLLWAPQ